MEVEKVVLESRREYSPSPEDFALNFKNNRLPKINISRPETQIKFYDPPLLDNMSNYNLPTDTSRLENLLQKENLEEGYKSLKSIKSSNLQNLIEKRVRLILTSSRLMRG